MNTVDGAEVLAKATGFGRSQIVELWESVKENHRKLDACPRHEFEVVGQKGIVARMQDRYRCKHCGGEIGASEHYWFQKGRGQP